jgi:Zn finger protein HypA/HybF involved in hydrogenase expression
MPNLWCWSCYGRQEMTETESLVFKCGMCGQKRDLSDPVEMFGKEGE